MRGQFIIVLSSFGEFHGYLKTISIQKREIKSTHSKIEAKHYAKQETALKDIESVGKITHGAFNCGIIQFNTD